MGAEAVAAGNDIVDKSRNRRNWDLRRYRVVMSDLFRVHCRGGRMLLGFTVG
jgi:hypothetical protein